MDKKQHLIQVFENFRNDESKVFEKIKNPENRPYYIPGLAGTNETLALYAIYIEHDFKKARLYYYKAARVKEYSTITYQRDISNVGIYDIVDALLSDDPLIIKRYSTIRNARQDETNFGFQIFNAAQNILLDDLEKLDKNIHQIERFLKFKQFEPINGLLDYFNGFKNQDISLITQGLENLLSKRKKRTFNPLTAKFISIDTTGYNKLAWIKGYEIDLKSPFVPIELMPVKPLEHYEDYDFLK